MGPCYLNIYNLFLTLSNQYCSPEQDSNLGPKHMSLLDFETRQLRPLGHRGGFLCLYISDKLLYLALSNFYVHISVKWFSAANAKIFESFSYCWTVLGIKQSFRSIPPIHRLLNWWFIVWMVHLILDQFIGG